MTGGLVTGGLMTACQPMVVAVKHFQKLRARQVPQKSLDC